MLLSPSVKNYPWGRLGKSSLVAELSLLPDAISEVTPYAELWMGSHPSDPSSILPEGPLLLEYIQANPKSLGERVLAKYGPQLPFLFKVLSVEKALSIQAHPDKSLAGILHKRDPANYPDDNHKPELALAVSQFEVLCGFRSLEEIERLVKEVPELRTLIGDERITSKDSLRRALSLLLKSDPSLIASKIKEIIGRQEVPEYELICRLNSQFPGDVGILCVFFLEHLVLEPGQAIFLPANEPHAYLSGDCIECMANSDNVVRAGLTPKFKDVDVLTEMLTFETGKEWIFKGQEASEGRMLFKPPVGEFAVEVIESQQDFKLDSKDSCSILLVIEGEACFDSNVDLSRGAVLFVPAGTTGSVAVKNKLKLYRAFCPV